MLTFAGFLFAALLVFLGGVVANWIPRPGRLTTGIVVGIAVVLIVASAVTDFVRRDPQGGGPGTEAPPSSHGSKTVPTPPKTAATVEPGPALQPAATFGCDDTDNSVAVAMHPGGSVVACVNASTTAIWNVANGQVPRQAKDLGVGAISAAFDSTGRALLTADDSCWTLFNGTRPWNDTGHECGLDPASAKAVIAPNGKTFATIASLKDSQVRFWNAASHQIVNTYTAADDEQIRSIAYSPTGRYFATGSNDAHPYLWDLGKNGQRRQLSDDQAGHADMVNAVAFSPDGKRLISGSADQTAKIWSVPDGKLITSLESQDLGRVNAVAFSPGGRTAVTGDTDHNVIVWDVASGNPVRALEGSTGEITSLSYDRAGTALAAGCSDGKVIVWSLN